MRQAWWHHPHLHVVGAGNSCDPRPAGRGRGPSGVAGRRGSVDLAPLGKALYGGLLKNISVRMPPLQRLAPRIFFSPAVAAPSRPAPHP